MSVTDWILLGVVALLVAFALVKTVRDRKKGKCGCGCDGCSGCTGCKKK